MREMMKKLEDRQVMPPPPPPPPPIRYFPWNYDENVELTMSSGVVNKVETVTSSIPANFRSEMASRKLVQGPGFQSSIRTSQMAVPPRTSPIAPPGPEMYQLEYPQPSRQEYHEQQHVPFAEDPSTFRTSQVVHESPQRYILDQQRQSHLPQFPSTPHTAHRITNPFMTPRVSRSHDPFNPPVQPVHSSPRPMEPPPTSRHFHPPSRGVLSAAVSASDRRTPSSVMRDHGGRRLLRPVPYSPGTQVRTRAGTARDGREELTSRGFVTSLNSRGGTRR